jgi:hypothetical protein
MHARTLVAAAVAAVAATLAAPVAGAGTAPDELLSRYQPVTVLDRFELFAPTTVDGFVDGSELQRLQPDGSYAAAYRQKSRLPSHGDGWRLDRTGCSAFLGFAALGCYDALDAGPSAVYGRHEEVGGTTVLQYWLFYEFNLWSLQYPPSPLVWQSHEGDWEVVTVVLDEDEAPVEVAYSQHCTGQRRPWAAVQRMGDHPVVYVASGSHANLFAPGVRPIAPACVPPQAAAFLASLGIVPLDVANPVGGRVLGPGTTAVERITDRSPSWSRFPGTWGETQWLSAPPPIGTVPFGAGPEGPALHDVWADPLGTIAGYPIS